jgi:hypothetical protein
MCSFSYPMFSRSPGERAVQRYGAGFVREFFQSHANSARTLTGGCAAKSRRGSNPANQRDDSGMNSDDSADRPLQPSCSHMSLRSHGNELGIARQAKVKTTDNVSIEQLLQSLTRCRDVVHRGLVVLCGGGCRAAIHEPVDGILELTCSSCHRRAVFNYDRISCAICDLTLMDIDFPMSHLGLCSHCGNVHETGHV